MAAKAGGEAVSGATGSSSNSGRGRGKGRGWYNKNRYPQKDGRDKSDKESKDPFDTTVANYSAGKP